MNILKADLSVWVAAAHKPQPQHTQHKNVHEPDGPTLDPKALLFPQSNKKDFFSKWMSY